MTNIYPPPPQLKILFGHPVAKIPYGMKMISIPDIRVRCLGELTWNVPTHYQSNNIYISYKNHLCAECSILPGISSSLTNKLSSMEIDFHGL